jgi:hypothetical protein
MACQITAKRKIVLKCRELSYDFRPNDADLKLLAARCAQMLGARVEARERLPRQNAPAPFSS